jgi:hypothetical protein
VFKSIFLLFLCVCAFSAHSMEYREFLKLSDEEKVEFLSDETDEQYVQAALDSFIELNPSFVSKMTVIGEELSDIWGDTILEGPFTQESDVTVELNSLYKYNGVIYAASVQVWAHGLFIETENCDYDEENDSWVGDCQEVRIYQNFYMDRDGNLIESDDYAEVDF